MFAGWLPGFGILTHVTEIAVAVITASKIRGSR